MKRVLCFLMALVLSGLCAACGGPEEPEPEDSRILSVSPLIRTAAEAAGETRLIPTEEGFLALWERAGGFSASYLSPDRSELVEEAFTGDVLPEKAAFLETETGRGILAAGGKVWYVLLGRKGAEERALPEGVTFTGVFYRDEGLVCRKGTLLLLVTADLAQTLVLGDAARLPGFSEVLSVSRDGRLLWYLRRDGAGRGTGVAALAVGEDRVERSLDVSFDEAYAASPDGFFFRRDTDAGSVFTRLDPETKEAAAVSVPFVPARAAVSPDGAFLALWDEAGTAIRLFDAENGRETARKGTEEWGDVSALCFCGGRTLCAALRRDGGELLLSLS